MPKTIKETVYLNEESYAFVQAEVEAGRMNKQRFYNLAIENAITNRQTEQKKVSNYNNHKHE